MPEDALRRFLESRDVDLDSHDAIFGLLQAAAITVNVMEARALRVLGLSHAGYRLLLELWVNGPLEPHQLAGFMLVTKPTIVGTLDTLERSGLVIRTPVERDRRRVLVALTPEGVARIEDADRAWREWQKRATAQLTAEEKRVFADLASRIARSLMEERG